MSCGASKCPQETRREISTEWRGEASHQGDRGEPPQGRELCACSWPLRKKCIFRETTVTEPDIRQAQGTYGHRQMPASIRLQGRECGREHRPSRSRGIMVCYVGPSESHLSLPSSVSSSAKRVYYKIIHLILLWGKKKVNATIVGPWQSINSTFQGIERNCSGISDFLSVKWSFPILHICRILLSSCTNFRIYFSDWVEVAQTLKNVKTYYLKSIAKFSIKQ